MRLTFRLPVLLGLALLLPSLADARFPGWRQFTNGDNVLDVALTDSVAWIGTDVGLVRYTIATGVMRQFNTANSNLPDNRVSAVAVDSRGRVWVGTRGAIARYNGRGWVVWDSSSAGWPFSTEIGFEFSAFEFDLFGDLWIATTYGPVVQFDGANWTAYDSADGLPSPFNNDLAVDAWGDVWVANGQGLAHWNWSEWHVYDTTNSPIPDNYVNTVDIDDNGAAWVGTRAGFAKYDGAWEVHTAANTPFLAGGELNDDVLEIDTDPWGFAWLGTFQGLVRWNGGYEIFNTQNSGLRASIVTLVRTDDAGNEWVAGALSGLDRFDGSGWLAIPTSNSGLPSNVVTQVEIGLDRSVWTSAGKVARFVDNTWTVYDETNSPLRFGASIAIDSTGGVWFGNEDGLFRFANNAWTSWDSTKGLPVSQIREVRIDRENAVWFTGIHETMGYVLVHFDGTNFHVYSSLDHAALASPVYGLAFDSKNTAWIGAGTTLLRFDGTTFVEYDSTVAPLPKGYILSIDIGPGDVIWFGISGNANRPITPGGLVRYDGTTWTVYTQQNSPLGWPHVTHVRVAPDGAVWLATETDHGFGNWPGGALIRFDGTSWTQYTLQNSGLPYDWIHDIAFRPNGQVWVATGYLIGTPYGGLASFNPAAAEP